jgi:hypothetical protein
LADDKMEPLTSIEKTPFFEPARAHDHGFLRTPCTVAIMAVWLGARSADDSLEHTPPFGYYDALPRGAAERRGEHRRLTRRTSVDFVVIGRVPRAASWLQPSTAGFGRRSSKAAGGNSGHWEYTKTSS